MTVDDNNTLWMEIVVNISNPNTWEEAERTGVQGHTWLQSKSQASYMKSCLENQSKSKTPH